jgi:predicted HTH domain antitoxin
MSDVLSVKIDKDKLKLLEEMAREEETDRSTVARKLLDMGIRDWKTERSVKLFSEGKVSLWKAAEIAGVSLREFIEIVKERKLSMVKIKSDDIDIEVNAILKERR